MVDILDYQGQQAPQRSSRRRTLAAASTVLVLLASALEGMIIVIRGSMRYDEASVLLILGVGLLAFVAWFLGVIFGIVAIVDHDGPRPLARSALLLAAALLIATLLIPW